MHREKTIFAIAINEYDDVHCQSLDNAVPDAFRFIKVLQERFGFAKAGEPLINNRATGDNILEHLYQIGDGAPSEDVLIIFFAGHGGQHIPSKLGYWFSYDGQDPADKKKLLWNSRILEVINTMSFKHVLLVSDSCYSGTFITRTPASTLPSTLEEADRLQSRWVFVAGGEERVKDGRSGSGSPFVNSVCKFLETTRKKRFPATDLFNAVKLEFAGLAMQSPDAAPLNSPGHLGGILTFESTDPASTDDGNSPVIPFPTSTVPFPDHYLPRTVSPRNGEKELTTFFGLAIVSMKLSDVIESENRIALLGNAGSGKSQELRYMWDQLVHSGGRFQPIYRRFNTYAGQAIDDFLPKGWEEIDPYMRVFLFDGLDEVQPQYFAIAARNLEEFVAQHPISKFIISCRTNFYELPGRNFTGTLSDFKAFKLNDISLNEIKDYVSSVRHLDGHHFLQEIQEHRLIDLVQKPFFLELLIRYFQERGELTHQRSDIIQSAVLAQLAATRERLKATDLGRRLDESTVSRMLKRIAFVMEQMGKNYLSDSELKSIYLSSEDQLAVRELPYLNYDGENKQWQFEHNNIQEYLAATVLAALPIDKLLATVTIPGAEAVKPSWANTLSFFVSIGKEAEVKAFLDWLIKHESGFIFRFEPERIPRESRVKVVLDMVKNHEKENIWFSSTLYDEEDIARIGNFPEVIHHLQGDLDNGQASNTVRMNAYRVLRAMNFDDYPAEKKAFSDRLLQLAKSSDIPEHFRYSALRTLGDLQLLTPEEIHALVSLYGSNINAYIRAGLYSLLIATRQVNDYVEVFLDGLNVENILNPTGTRSSVSLLDEESRLVDGLTKISRTDSVLKLLEHVYTPGIWRHFSRDDNRAIIENAVNAAVLAYPGDDSIFGVMLERTMQSASYFEKDNSERFCRFFIETNTTLPALIKVLLQPKVYIKEGLIPLLVNDDTLTQITDPNAPDNLTSEQFQDIYETLFWQVNNNAVKKEFLKEFKLLVRDTFGIQLEEPDPPVARPIVHRDDQGNLDMIFNRQKFKEGIEFYYLKAGAETLSWEGLIELRRKFRDDPWQLTPVFTLFSDYFHGSTLYHKSTFRHFIDTPGFETWSMQQLHRMLQEDTDKRLVISPNQQSVISNWVKVMIDAIDLVAAITRSDYNVGVLWHFIQRFHISVEEKKLLPFMLYYDFGPKPSLAQIGTIDDLESFISSEILQGQLSSNLNNKGLPVLSWLNNAAYAIKRGMNHTFPAITTYLVAATDFDYNYKELLQIWGQKVDASIHIEEIAQTANHPSLQLTALEIMVGNATQSDTAKSILIKLVNDEKLDTEARLSAADLMIRINDDRGIQFYVDQFHTAKIKPGRYDMGLPRSIALIKTPAAIGPLLQLIAIALHPNIRSRDELGFFFSQLLDGLFNIGIQSAESLQEVDRQVNEFIAGNQGKLADLEVLKVNLRRLHERFNGVHTQPPSLQEAIAQFEEIG